MKRGDDLLERITGDPGSVPLRHLILNLLLVFALSAGCFFSFVDTIFRHSWGQSLFDFGLTLSFAVFFWMSRWKGLSGPVTHVAAVSSLVYVAANFFGNAGSSGSGWVVASMVAGIMAVIQSPKAAAVYGLSALAVQALCVLMEGFHPEWVLPYANADEARVDLVASFVVCGLTLFLVLAMVMRFYREATSRLQEALTSSAQAEKMAALGETMANLNHEIANPVGVMSLALSNVQDWWTSEAPGVQALLQKIEPSRMRALWTFVGTAVPALDTSRSVQISTQRDYREHLMALGWEDAEDSARDLAEFAQGPWNPAWEQWLVGPHAADLLRLAVRTMEMLHSLRSLRLAQDQLMELVTTMGSYARSDGETRKLAACHLADELNMVLTLFVGHRRKTIEVVRSYEEVGPVWVHGEQMAQVWTNLVKNAVSAIGERGLLCVRIAQDGNRVMVSISDSGPGVPTELRHRIFEPFFTTKPKGKGTGLGLGIVRRIVHAHGGAVSVDQGPEGGARFTVTLPIGNPNARQ